MQPDEKLDYCPTLGSGISVCSRGKSMVYSRMNRHLPFRFGWVLPENIFRFKSLFNREDLVMLGASYRERILYSRNFG